MAENKAAGVRVAGMDWWCNHVLEGWESIVSWKVYEELRCGGVTELGWEAGAGLGWAKPDFVELLNAQWVLKRAMSRGMVLIEEGEVGCVDGLTGNKAWWFW